MVCNRRGVKSQTLVAFCCGLKIIGWDAIKLLLLGVLYEFLGKSLVIPLCTGPFFVSALRNQEEIRLFSSLVKSSLRH